MLPADRAEFAGIVLGDIVNQTYYNAVRVSCLFIFALVIFFTSYFLHSHLSLLFLQHIHEIDMLVFIASECQEEARRFQ